jgi:hypothetical protein
MNKKLLIPALLAATLTACGGGTKTQNSDSGAATTQTAAQTTETAKPAESKTPAANKPAYVIADKLGEKFILQDANIPYDQRRVVPAQTPDTIKNFKYIIEGGKYYPVKLVGYQVGSEDGDNGRDMWYNFDNMCGWVYQMESGKLLENPKEEWDACWAYPLLVDDAFKNSAKVHPPKSTYKDGKETPLPKDLKEKFEQKYGRQVLRGTLDYTFGDNDEYKFVNVQFKNKGTQALGVVAVVKPDGSIASLDLQREWNEESCWRVDDGGEFNGYGLEFATVENGKMYVYLADQGAEGLNLDNYEVTDGALRLGKVGASFYQAPE